MVDFPGLYCRGLGVSPQVKASRAYLPGGGSGFVGLGRARGCAGTPGRASGVGVAGVPAWGSGVQAGPGLAGVRGI